MLCFVNTIVQVTKGSNAKVFHQHEFMEAGFNPDEVEKVQIRASLVFSPVTMTLPTPHPMSPCML